MVNHSSNNNSNNNDNNSNDDIHTTDNHSNDTYDATTTTNNNNTIINDNTYTNSNTNTNNILLIHVMMVPVRLGHVFVSVSNRFPAFRFAVVGCFAVVCRSTVLPFRRSTF